MVRQSKQALIDELIREFRVSGNQDDAFDSLAAERLGVTETDLRCLNIIENDRGLSAGDLAVRSGLTPGAITGVIDRLERVGYARRVPDAADRRRTGWRSHAVSTVKPNGSGGRWRATGVHRYQSASRSTSSNESRTSSETPTSLAADTLTGSARSAERIWPIG